MTPQDSYHTDVIIIGAGPVGLFAIFECGMLGMKCHNVDSLAHIGGQCTTLYPEKPIYDIPAHPLLSGQQLIDYLKKQVKPFQPVYHLEQQVIRCVAHKDGFWVETSRGTTIDARAVIIAAGVGAFGPNRPPLRDIKSYEGKSIFYFVRSPEDFRGKRIVILGGGDSAIDWCLALVDLAKHIIVVHRRQKFRCAPESVKRLYALEEQGKVTVFVPYQLKGFQGKDGILTGVWIANFQGEERLLDADRLLIFLGLSMNLGPITQWGLNLDRNHIVIDPSTAETNIPGIFAIGDIATYKKKLKLILTGFAEAAQAAHAIYSLVFPGQALHFEYSTTLGVPKFDKPSNP